MRPFDGDGRNMAQARRARLRELKTQNEPPPPRPQRDAEGGKVVVDRKNGLFDQLLEQPHPGAAFLDSPPPPEPFDPIAENGEYADYREPVERADSALGANSPGRFSRASDARSGSTRGGRSRGARGTFGAPPSGAQHGRPTELWSRPKITNTELTAHHAPPAEAGGAALPRKGPVGHAVHSVIEQIETRAVRWGDGTFDEMCLGSIQMTLDR